MENKNDIVNSYLTFKIGNEIFATNVNNVLNIIELIKITKVPHSPSYMRGIINLRGNMLSVVDTRLMFGMYEIEYTTNTSIIVMDIKNRNDITNIGMIVDCVSEVLIINDNEIKPSPSIGNSYKSDFITGVVTRDEQLIMVVDMIKVFSDKNLKELMSLKQELKEYE